jgi:SAM-dependent methyltransferase
MLAHAKERFAGNGRVRLVEHNLDARLPELGSFDAVVSSFAIHHCEDDRKRSLYAEIFEMLEPGGCFCNLEHVASPSEMLHHRFLAELELRPEEEDPSNKLLDVHTQLEWLRELGFEHVDCVWKWRELALLVGRKASGVTQSSECHDEPSVRH